MKDKAKGVGILALLGGSKPSKGGDDYESDDDMDSGELALKAAFRAVKEDDFEAFRDGMKEWMACQHDSDDSDD